MFFRHKITRLVGATLLVAAIVGCDNNKEEVQSFINTTNGVELKFTYHHKGDVVTRQDADNKLPYQAVGASNEEQARKIIAPIGEAYRNVKGVTHTVEYKDTYMLEHISVDFNQTKISDLCKLPGTSFTDCSQKFVSFSKSEQLLKAQGFSEVK